MPKVDIDFKVDTSQVVYCNQIFSDFRIKMVLLLKCSWKCVIKRKVPRRKAVTKENTESVPSNENKGNIFVLAVSITSFYFLYNVTNFL